MMKAAIFKGKGAIELGERPDPTIKEPTDAVVRVVRSCVCGSDHWYYRGESDYPVGSPIGHEFLGVVEHVGESVQTIAQGNLVIAPFLYSDGTAHTVGQGLPRPVFEVASGERTASMEDRAKRYACHWQTAPS